MFVHAVCTQKRSGVFCVFERCLVNIQFSFEKATLRFVKHDGMKQSFGAALYDSIGLVCIKTQGT